MNKTPACCSVCNSTRSIAPCTDGALLCTTPKCWRTWLARTMQTNKQARTVLYERTPDTPHAAFEEFRRGAYNRHTTDATGQVD